MAGRDDVHRSTDWKDAILCTYSQTDARPAFTLYASRMFVLESSKFTMMTARHMHGGYSSSREKRDTSVMSRSEPRMSVTRLPVTDYRGRTGEAGWQCPLPIAREGGSVCAGVDVGVRFGEPRGPRSVLDAAGGTGAQQPTPKKWKIPR